MFSSVGSTSLTGYIQVPNHTDNSSFLIHSKSRKHQEQVCGLHTCSVLNPTNSIRHQVGYFSFLISSRSADSHEKGPSAVSIDTI